MITTTLFLQAKGDDLHSLKGVNSYFLDMT